MQIPLGLSLSLGDVIRGGNARVPDTSGGHWRTRRQLIATHNSTYPTLFVRLICTTLANLFKNVFRVRKQVPCVHRAPSLMALFFSCRNRRGRLMGDKRYPVVVVFFLHLFGPAIAF